MSARELAEWMAHDAESPLPDRRADLHFAHLAHLVATAGLKKKGGGAWAVADFLLFQPPPEPTEAERQADLARRLIETFRALGAKVDVG
jgi:hypothetical protein